VHCCSTVFTDVTSLTSSTLVPSLAKRTCISEDYCWYVNLQCYETEIQGRCVKSSTYRSATTKCTGQFMRQTNNLKSPTKLLFVEHYIGAGNCDVKTWFYRCRCWSKLWVWRRVVRQTRHSFPTDRKWKRIRQGAVIRGVRSARCKVTLAEQHSAVSPGTGLSSLWRSAADSSSCTYCGNYFHFSVQKYVYINGQLIALFIIFF